MKKLTYLAVLVVVAAFPSTAMADDTICANMSISGTHDNVIVPAGTFCTPGAAGATTITGSVKVYGRYNARAGTTIHGNIDGEPGHVWVRLFGLGVVVHGNVQIKQGVNTRNAGSAGYLTGTRIDGDFQWEENSMRLLASGGIIGGDLKMEKSDSSSRNLPIGRIFGNTIGGNLQCKENTPPPVGGGNSVTGNMEDQCSAFD